MSGVRVKGKITWTGSDDKYYLDEFQRMWETFLKNLKEMHKPIFREEIEHRLNSEFRHCGTLGKEHIS